MEPSGPAVVAADPCDQVRRDTTAVGGDGGVLRVHLRRCRPSWRRMLWAPNLTGGLRFRVEKRARLLGARLAAWPDCDPAADEEGTDEDRRDLLLRTAAQ
ncbi:hypothetical protein NDU88_005305 [Pleurodeles waltl]|uniref:Uncharacterized protein n=1 Tax=Pleurodeles waltl TaxID=8319 RepID=A0AAV7RLY6_PLEWA|nr:hypothetical protein NDU88_005305 [Pleurodeles waltl]